MFWLSKSSSAQPCLAWLQVYAPSGPNPRKASGQYHNEEDEVDDIDDVPNVLEGRTGRNNLPDCTTMLHTLVYMHSNMELCMTIHHIPRFCMVFVRCFKNEWVSETGKIECKQIEKKPVFIMQNVLKSVWVKNNNSSSSAGSWCRDKRKFICLEDKIEGQKPVQNHFSISGGFKKKWRWLKLWQWRGTGSQEINNVMDSKHDQTALSQGLGVRGRHLWRHSRKRASTPGMQ